jgi:hypothetical protein
MSCASLTGVTTSDGTGQAHQSEHAQAAIRRVRDAYAGEPVDEVYRELVAEVELETGLRINPNDDALREYAEAIVRGDLPD